MSPYRAALIAFGHGEWAFVDGTIVRVARERPLQLCSIGSCTRIESVDNRPMANPTKRASTGSKRTPATKSRATTARKATTSRRSTRST